MISYIFARLMIKVSMTMNVLFIKLKSNMDNCFLFSLKDLIIQNF